MSKAKKIILNGKNVIGIVWESEGKDLIVFDNDKAIDFNHGISIRDIDTDKEDYIDLLDLISKKITYPEKEQPKGIEVKNSDGSTFAVLKQGEIMTTGKLIRAYKNK